MATTIVLIPNMVLPYRYHCDTCQRTAVSYGTEAMAQLDADRHDCANPRWHELDPAQLQASNIKSDKNRRRVP